MAHHPCPPVGPFRPLPLPLPETPVDTAPDGAKDNLRALTERVGKTLNIFGEMAHAPLVLDSSDDDAIAIRTGSVDDPALAAAIAVAREIAADKGHVTDATWAAALETGWTDAQLLEVFLEVVRTIFTNYFNHLVGTELDLPAAPDLAS